MLRDPYLPAGVTQDDLDRFMERDEDGEDFDGQQRVDENERYAGRRLAAHPALLEGEDYDDCPF